MAQHIPEVQPKTRVAAAEVRTIQFKSGKVVKMRKSTISPRHKAM